MWLGSVHLLSQCAPAARIGLVLSAVGRTKALSSGTGSTGSFLSNVVVAGYPVCLLCYL